MVKNKTLIIILAGVIVLSLTAYLLLSNNYKAKHDWRESFRNDKKEPYGTYVVSELLEKYFPGKTFHVMHKPLHESLPRSNNANYVFIGSGMFLDSLGEQKLLEFVSRGNNAFISLPYIPGIIEDTLHLNICEFESTLAYYEDSLITLNFYDTSFSAKTPYPCLYRYINDTAFYSWSYISEACMSENAGIEYYGKMNNTMKNYARIPFGKGFFYLHTTPLAFSNLHMLNKRALEYASKVFSYLPEGDIYWDEFSKIPVSYSYDRNYGGQLEWEKSPLHFILSQPALKTAWYLTLAFTLLYMLFRAKRKQRIIPVLIPNTNTSLEFAETIGRIYYLQNDHKKLAMQKMKLFLEWIRNRYGFSTAQLDEIFFVKLAQKSQVPQKEIEKLFERFRAIEYLEKISEHMLINFNQSIDNFHKKAK